MSDSQYVYGQYPIPSDPRVILAALDRRMAQGIGGHSRAARMQEHRARLVEQIAAMDSAPVQASSDSPNWVQDRVAAQEYLASVIEPLTVGKVGNYAPSLDETAAVVTWCREWVADTFGDGIEHRLSSLEMLSRCNDHIDGGLAFVLADVRRVATDPSTLMQESSMQMIDAIEDAAEEADYQFTQNPDEWPTPAQRQADTTRARPKGWV